MASADPNYVRAVGLLRQRQQQLADEIREGRYETTSLAFQAERLPLGPKDRMPVLDREALGSRFIDLFARGGVPAADHRSLVGQSDLMASAEKAMRARHRSRVVHLVYGAARSLGGVGPGGLYEQALVNLPVLEA